MLTRSNIGSFLEALYEDHALKNKLLIWTFAALVLPAALLVALGLPEKHVYVTMAALLFPLQFVVYSLGERSNQPRAATTLAQESAYRPQAGNQPTGDLLVPREH
jgi:hypothetical protein